MRTFSQMNSVPHDGLGKSNYENSIPNWEFSFEGALSDVIGRDDAISSGRSVCDVKHEKWQFLQRELRPIVVKIDIFALKPCCREMKQWQ